MEGRKKQYRIGKATKRSADQEKRIQRVGSGIFSYGGGEGSPEGGSDGRNEHGRCAEGVA